MKRLRVYTDTSVIGGCLDLGFDEYSLEFLKRARSGELIMLWSDLAESELSRAKPVVYEILLELDEESIEWVKITSDMLELAAAYIDGGVVGTGTYADALHVAAATVSNADCIVSRNFRHLVNLAKIRRFNAVNLRQRYRQIDIRSPREFISL